MEDSTNNLINHNNFINNTIQVYDTNPANNNWYHPTLLEGNYWSNYTGVDDGSGIGKHAIAGDNIGDTELPHPTTDYDYYPFIAEDGWIKRPPVAIANITQAGEGIKLVNVRFWYTRHTVTCTILEDGIPLLTLGDEEEGQFIFFSDRNYEAYYVFDRIARGRGHTQTFLRFQAEGGTIMKIHMETFTPPPDHQERTVNIDEELGALGYSADNRIYTFDGIESYDPDGGDIVSWTWEVYDDGNVLIETVYGEVVTYTFPTTGQYMVRLIVEDNEDETHFVDTTVSV